MFLSAYQIKVKAQDLARKIQEMENEKRDPGNDYECCRWFFVYNAQSLYSSMILS